MIVVKIELHSAITGKVEEIGRTIIHNVGTTKDGKRGWYKVAVGRKKADTFNSAEVLMNPIRTGEVDDYPRLSYNVWRLVIRSLLSAFPEERTKK